MKYLLFIFLFYSSLSFSQQKADYKSSFGDITGNDNNIIVVQGNNIVKYDLNDDKEVKSFLKYLEALPTIKSAIKELLKSTDIMIDLLKKINHKIQDEGVFDIDKFFTKLEEYIKANEELKKENVQLRKQTSDSNYSIALRMANERLLVYDNDEYHRILDNYINENQKNISIQNKRVSTVHYLQARNFFNNFREQEALDKINKALEYDSLNETYLVIKGDILFQIFEYDKSLAIFFKLEAMSQTDSIKSVIYNYIGLIYHSKGNDSLALNYLLKSLDFARMGSQEINENDALSTVYNSIGGIHASKDDYDNALPFFKKALLNNSEITNVPVYNNIGATYMGLGNMDSALFYFFKSLNINKEVFGDLHPFNAACYGNIGVAFGKIDRFKDALEYLKRAIEMEEKIYGTDNPVVGESYDNIGSIYRNLNDTLMSLSYFKKALNIFQKWFGESHPRMASIYNNLASEYLVRSDFDSALIFYRKSLPICLKQVGEESFKTKGLYENMGFILIARGETALGLSNLSKCDFEKLSECEKAKSLYEAALYHYERRKWQNALNLLIESLSFLEKANCTKTNEIWANVYFHQGRCYCFLNRKGDSKKAFRKTMDLCRKNVASAESIKMLENAIVECN